MASLLIVFILGSIFGLIIQYASLNKYNVISAQSLLEDNTVLKTILITIGFGAILLSILMGLGFAHFHIKAFMLGGVIFGGLLFGMGMAILGYCPGTLAVSVGEGALDALVGIIGGLFGGLVFSLLFSKLKGLLGINFGKISLFSFIGNELILYYLLVLVIGLLFIYLAFFIHKKESNKNKKWIIAGILLAILNSIVFVTSNRPIGASTSYPYVADIITHTTNNPYFSKIEKPGKWEMIFLLGAMLAAFLGSVIKKDFRFTVIYSNWEKHKGNSKIKRIIWAFIGGFILIFGARMAGGCTSGHIISGGMQLALSSLVFALAMFIGLVSTGKKFYKQSKN